MNPTDMTKLAQALVKQWFTPPPKPRPTPPPKPKRKKDVRFKI